jgi:hypothetical protein
VSLIPLVLLIVCVLCFVQGYKLLHAAKKYEFDNRSGGGVVEFKEFGDSMKHNSRKMLAGLLIMVGSFGVPILAVVCFVVYFRHGSLN